MTRPPIIPERHWGRKRPAIDDLTDREAQVFAVLAAMTDGEASPAPSTAEVAAKLHASARTAAGVLSKLAGRGLVRSRPETLYHGDGTTQRVSCWRLAQGASAGGGRQ